MTARVLRWLRGPWVAPDPAPDLSWLDRKDGLDTRYCGAIQPSAEELADTRTWLETRRDILARASAAARADLHATLRAEGTRYDAVLDSGPADPEPTRTRYDAEWPSVLAAEAGGWAGGDLAAMTAPLTGMARDDLGTYAEPVVVHIEADVSAFRDTMYRLAQDASMARPRGRHRQTDPLDLILADLRDLSGL